MNRVLKNDLDIPSFRDYLAQRINVGDDPQTMIADLDLDRSTFLSAFVTITKFIDELDLIRNCMKDKKIWYLPERQKLLTAWSYRKAIVPYISLRKIPNMRK